MKNTHLGPLTNQNITQIVTSVLQSEPAYSTPPDAPAPIYGTASVAQSENAQNMAASVHSSASSNMQLSLRPESSYHQTPLCPTVHLNKLEPTDSLLFSRQVFFLVKRLNCWTKCLIRSNFQINENECM